jgi:LPS-assembly protein
VLRPFSSRRRPPSVPAPLAVAALLCVAAGAASAQSLPPVRKAPPPREAAGTDVPSPVITLTADDVVSHIGGVAQARGKVELTREDVVLHADYLTYDQLSDTAHAEGHVRIARGLDWFSASRLDLEVTRNAGTLQDTEYELGATKAGGHAKRIELQDREHATAFEGDYSSCPRDVPGHPPDWIITGEKIDIDTSTNEGHATRAVLRFLGVPILAAPSLSFPVTSERKSGWLPPTADFSNSSGLSVGVPYYWNLRPDVDLTLTPEVITRRGAALTTEVRYLGSGDLGQATGYSVPADQLTGGDSRGSIQWAHEGTRADWLSYSARWQRVSDDQYWKDFPHQMPALTQRLLPLDLSGTRRFLPFGDSGEIDTYARVQRFQTLQDYEDPDAVILSPYQRSPQLGMRGDVAFADKLKLSWETEANRFDLSDQDRPTLPGFTPDARTGGYRAHAIGAISREFSSAWGRIEPRLSVNGATYHTDRPMADGRQSVTRWIPTFSADSSFSFEKQAELFGRDVVQTLEPRLLYVLTPYHDQKNLPLYDTAPKDFNEVSIYSDNQFTGIDRISDENQLTAGATTRFNDAVNGRELLRLGIAQRLLFKDQKVTPDGTPDNRKLSDLLLWGSSSLMEHWSFDGTLEFNPSSDWTQRAIISTRWHPGPYKTLSATYRYARGSSEQYEFGGQWPVYRRAPDPGVAGGCGGTLYAVGRMNYSVSDSRATYALGGFEYDAGCWIGRLMVERQSTGRNESSTHIVLQLELNGLSTLGTGSLRVLKDNVPGYQPLRNDPGAPVAAPNPP